MVPNFELDIYENLRNIGALSIGIGLMCLFTAKIGLSAKWTKKCKWLAKALFWKHIAAFVMFMVFYMLSK